MKLNKKKLISSIISLFSILFLAFVDQLIKYFVERDLKPIESKTLIKGFLGLSYVQNHGGMMGTFQNKAGILLVFSLIILAAIFLYILFSSQSSPVFNACLTLIAAGGLGNAIDRMLRGYVTDYIEFLFVKFYVFNFADMLVTCSCILLVIYEIYLMAKGHSKGKENA